jgi:hypothetical protein
MPHFTNLIDYDGPIINVLVAPSFLRQNSLTAAGLQVPAPIFARMLIDTGASSTCIEESILTNLGLVPTGAIMMNIPSTGQAPLQAFVYDVSMQFSGHNGNSYTFHNLAAVGCDFSGQNIDGLFGRDALAQARFIYSGPDSSWMLSL